MNYKINPTLVYTHDDNELVILDVNQENYVVLNGTASMILLYFKQAASVESLKSFIFSEFEGDTNTMNHDIEHTLKYLIDSKYLISA